MEKIKDLMYPNIDWNEVWKVSIETKESIPGGQACSAYFENSDVVEQYNRWSKNEGAFNFKDKLLQEISRIEDLEILRVSPVWEQIYMSVWPSLYGIDYSPKQNIDCIIKVL